MAFKDIIHTIWYVIVCTILSVLLLLSIGILAKTIDSDIINIYRLTLHNWLTVGFLLFFIMMIIPKIRRNARWLMKFTHEFTHMVFAVLFCRDIYQFSVGEKDCHVSFSNGRLGYHVITLSPYCIPLFTLALLPWRFTTGPDVFLDGIDILIGFTYAFHVCCWIKQTRLHQTDIIGPGIVKSLLIIAIVNILILSLVILTPTSGVEKAFVKVFYEFPKDLIIKFTALIR